jgi:Ankyrin repeats (3 copies)
MTLGLHWYKGMIVGIAMQTIMGPVTLLENPLVKALLLGSGIREDAKIFDEKKSNELTPEDEVVDESGNPIVRAADATAIGDSSSSFEDVVLDTWDAGNKADIAAFMSAVNEKNCNYRTKESGWTPLMILSGLNAKGTASAIRQIKELGGDPAITDAEGWNCLHWAAFHGSIEAAKELAKDYSLLSVKDKEGKLPLEMAKAEGNDDVAKFLETCTETESTSKNNSDGLRKRK